MQSTSITKPKKKHKVLKRVLIITACVILVLVIGMFAAIPPLVMGDLTKRPAKMGFYEPEEFGVDASRITLQTEDGLNIAAWEVTPQSPKATVILLSGIQNPSVTGFFGYAKMLRDNGYASLLIEMRAHGESEGEEIQFGMSEYLDVKAGVTYLTEQRGDLPIVVWGTSMGGATAINAMGEIPELDGLISCSAFASLSDMFCDSMELMGTPKAFAVIQKPFVSLYCRLEYGSKMASIYPLNEIQKLNGRPALLMHSTKDSQVPYVNFERLMAKVKGSVETFVREGDYHFIINEDYFKDPTLDAEFSSAVLDFLNKHFG